MPEPSPRQINWFDQPEEHNYPAAESYLALFEEKTVADYVKRLRQARMSKFKAKDIFRASGLSLLGVSNTSRGEGPARRLLGGTKLSPLLLVRDTGAQQAHHRRRLSPAVFGLPVRRGRLDSLQDRLSAW